MKKHAVTDPVSKFPEETDVMETFVEELGKTMEHVEELGKTMEQLKALLAEALDLLEEIEWDNYSGACLFCLGEVSKQNLLVDRERDQKHTPDCRWLTIMKKAGRR